MKASVETSDSASNSRLSKKPAEDLIWNRCQAWLKKLLDWAGRFTSGRMWTAKATLLSVFFTIFIAGGFGFETIRDGYVNAYYEKIEHPLKDLTLTYDAGGHEAKLNCRLTVPVVLHILGLHAHWTLPALTISAVVAILWLSCLLAYQVTGSRIVALFMALEVCSTYIGSFGWIMAYDAIALALVALAFLSGVPWYLRGAIVFAAAFTDERGFLASLFLLPFCATLSDDRIEGWRRIINRNTLAVAGAGLLYIIARLLLQYVVGMKSTFKGVGPGSFASHVPHWHAGVWFALEGGWLLVVLAMVSLCLRKQYLRLFLLVVPLTGILLGSFINGDLVRSTAYLFPAIFVALQILREHETDRTLILYAVFAFFASVVAGNYNVFIGQITWFMPLPVYLFYKLCTAVVLWGRAAVGWKG